MVELARTIKGVYGARMTGGGFGGCTINVVKSEEVESFRYSAGLGVAWNSPIGPLKFSYGVPINKKPGDRIQKFQFQVGTVF